MTEDEYKEYFKKRAEHSKKVIDSNSSKRLVMAGPGTGKSFLFQEIARDLKKQGKDSILVLTFINELVKDIDLIVDAMDNFATRFILNQAAFSRHLPMIHGAVRGFFGQATTLIPGKTGCLQCFFAGNPLGEIIPVIGATCGVIGSVQASETIKVLTGRGEPLTNRLFFWDGWAGEGTVIDAKRNPRCIICGGG